MRSASEVAFSVRPYSFALLRPHCCSRAEFLSISLAPEWQFCDCTGATLEWASAVSPNRPYDWWLLICIGCRRRVTRVPGVMEHTSARECPKAAALQWQQLTVQRKVLLFMMLHLFCGHTEGWPAISSRHVLVWTLKVSGFWLCKSFRHYVLINESVGCKPHKCCWPLLVALVSLVVCTGQVD